jgi:cobyrinic acid a,c-diamide synthase
MPALCRLVIAAISEQHEPAGCTIALLAALRSRGFEVQHFRSLSAFTPVDYVTPLTGIASRHLDPWVMTDSLCRELFVHSAAAVDVSVIEACAGDESHGTAAGGVDIARVLNAPLVGIVPSQPPGSFHAPTLPAETAAVLLDGFTSREHFEFEKAALEATCHVPVLGGLPAGHAGSDCVARMRAGRRIPGAALDELARSLDAFTDVERLVKVGGSRPFPSHTPELFVRPGSRRSLRVAVAHDDCFHCYFPDTLDALEFLGAELCMFSPLVDERLPDDTDIVYMGCGHPETHAQELSHNECMRAALRGHVSAGQRIYAEGGAAAYLCQQIRLPSGRVVPMVGVFAAEAQLTVHACSRPHRVALECRQPNWIADRGHLIRGYSNGRWQIVPRGLLKPCFSSGAAHPEAFVRHHCVGSVAHLNFAAQPRVLNGFFAPHAPSLSIAKE